MHSIKMETETNDIANKSLEEPDDDEESTGNKGSNSNTEWSTEEDKIFLEQVKICGTHNWKILAENFPGKSAKQCRQRWHNHLNPDIKRCAWSPDEDRILIQYQQQIGNKWAKIAKVLHGRTDNQIKNRFYSISRPAVQNRPYEDVLRMSLLPRANLTHPYTYENQSVYSQFSVDSGATTHVSLSPQFENLGSKRARPDHFSSQPLQPLQQQYHLKMQQKPAPLIIRPTHLDLGHNVRPQADPSHDFDLDDWAHLLDDHHPNSHNDELTSFEHDRLTSDTKINITKSSQDPSNSVARSLKQVPGHPYLFYDESHPMFPQNYQM